MRSPTGSPRPISGGTRRDPGVSERRARRGRAGGGLGHPLRRHRLVGRRRRRAAHRPLPGRQLQPPGRPRFDPPVAAGLRLDRRPHDLHRRAAVPGRGAVGHRRHRPGDAVPARHLPRALQHPGRDLVGHPGARLLPGRVPPVRPLGAAPPHLVADGRHDGRHVSPRTRRDPAGRLPGRPEAVPVRGRPGRLESGRRRPRRHPRHRRHPRRNRAPVLAERIVGPGSGRLASADPGRPAVQGLRAADQRRDDRRNPDPGRVRASGRRLLRPRGPGRAGRRSARQRELRHPRPGRHPDGDSRRARSDPDAGLVRGESGRPVAGPARGRPRVLPRAVRLFGTAPLDHRRHLGRERPAGSVGDPQTGRSPWTAGP